MARACGQFQNGTRQAGFRRYSAGQLEHRHPDRHGEALTMFHDRVPRNYQALLPEAPIAFALGAPDQDRRAPDTALDRALRESRQNLWIVRGDVLTVTPVSGTYQCAEIERIALGL